MPESSSPSTSVWNQLIGSDFRILEELIHLVRYRKRTRDPAASYVAPSQSYLGRKIGRTRVSVNRRIRRLAALGVIKVVFRRFQDGHYCTCLYTVTRSIRRRIATLMAVLSYAPRRVSRAAPNQNLSLRDPPTAAHLSTASP